MQYLLYALLLIFPLGQLGRIELLGSEVVLHLNDLLTFLLVFVWLFFERKRAFQILSKDSLAKPLFLWTAAMVVSLLVNSARLLPYEILVSSLYLFRFLGYAGLYFVVKDQIKEQQNVKRLMLITIIAVSIVGLLQYVFLPDVSFLKVFDWDDHYFRLVGTFLDPGFTGAVLAVGLVLVYLKNSRVRLNDYLMTIVIYIALSLTYSRASYLMYLVCFTVISWYRKSPKLFVCAVLVLVITLPLLPKSTGEGTKLHRENSITARINNWKQTVDVWKSFPLFGVGYNSYRYIQRDLGRLQGNGVQQSHSGAGADSSLLLVLATTGIVGFLAYLNLLFQIFKQHRRNALVIASLLGIVVHSFFNNTLFYPWVMEWLWLILALTWSTSEA